MKKEKFINALLAISFVFYAVFIIWNILFKYVSPINIFSTERYFSRSVNLIPFNDLLQGNYLRLDVWGNILLFIPLGIYMRVMKFGRLKTAGAAAGISILFETLQYAFALGATDITDVIYNTIGGLVGILIYEFLYLLLKKGERVKTFISVLAGTAAVFVLCIVILIYLYN